MIDSPRLYHRRTPYKLTGSENFGEYPIGRKSERNPTKQTQVLREEDAALSPRGFARSDSARISEIRELGSFWNEQKCIADRGESQALSHRAPLYDGIWDISL